MLKKSRIIAVLSLCVMMFAVVEPALAWDDDSAKYGAVNGTVLGSIVGGIIGFCVGGPAGAYAGAEAGAWIGGGTGTVIGGTGHVHPTPEEREEFNKHWDTMDNAANALEGLEAAQQLLNKMK